MKKFVCTVVCLSVLALLPVLGQDTNLTTFNLDFPGGTPADLLQAIGNATGKPMNVIIPAEDANTQLPPLKMNDVTTPKLFDALGQASQQGGSYYLFRTGDNRNISDSSIWYFSVYASSVPAAVCTFYQLQPYLDRGLTVNDITTAIQTGWKMSGITSPPELDYHKETKLLIAFGKEDELRIIENVLATLPKADITRDEADYVMHQAFKMNNVENRIDNLGQQINQLSAQVYALSTNLPASTENNSGK